MYCSECQFFVYNPICPYENRQNICVNKNSFNHGKWLREYEHACGDAQMQDKTYDMYRLDDDKD